MQVVGRREEIAAHERVATGKQIELRAEQVLLEDEQARPARIERTREIGERLNRLAESEHARVLDHGRLRRLDNLALFVVLLVGLDRGHLELTHVGR